MENEILDYFQEEDYYRGKIIAIKYFYFESQAFLYAARLREQGIKCFISNTNTITAFPLGDAGIGLHIREIDQQFASYIIERLDTNNKTEAQNISFHDADHEDIAYQRALMEKKTRKEPLIFVLLIVLSLVLIRAILKSNGLILWGDSF